MIAQSAENNPTFHHVGYVVQSIATAAAGLVKSLGFRWDERVFHDPLQIVRVSFFLPVRAGDPMLELVEPAGDDSPVAKFLSRGGGLHHVCYEVDSLEAQLELMRGNGDLIARAPQPAVAFDGRSIAWVYTKSRLLVEYLERSP